MDKILVIALIILAAGLLGGWAGYLADAPGGLSAGQDERTRVKRHLVLGLVAAWSVPLFLSVLQSALLKDIFSPRKENGVEVVPVVEYLIFAGFCLIAALSSRAFLDNLAKSVIRDVQDLKQHARAANSRIEDNTARVELVEESVDRDLGQPGAAAMETVVRDLEGQAVPDLVESERNALRAMARMTFRTATGIGKDIGVPRSQVGEILDALADRKLVERTTSPTTGGPRWRITPLGIYALNRG